MKRHRTSSTTLSQPPSKYYSISPSPEPDTGSSSQTKQWMCSLPPHLPLELHSLSAFEAHYVSAHTNTCLECHKNFPSPHYLNLHLREHHDPLLAVQRDRGEKIYACFVEHCEKLSSRPATRRMHLVDKHGFPREYDIYVVKDGLGGRRSMLREVCPKKAQTAKQKGDPAPSRSNGRQNEANVDEAGEESVDEECADSGSDEDMTEPAVKPSAPPKRKAEEEALRPSITSANHDNVDADVDINALTKGISSLRFVPNSVRFGRGKKGGLARR